MEVAAVKNTELLYVRLLISGHYLHHKTTRAVGNPPNFCWNRSQHNAGSDCFRSVHSAFDSNSDSLKHRLMSGIQAKKLHRNQIKAVVIFFYYASGNKVLDTFSAQIKVRQSLAYPYNLLQSDWSYWIWKWPMWWEMSFRTPDPLHKCEGLHTRFPGLSRHPNYPWSPSKKILVHWL